MTSRLLPKKARKALCTWALTKTPTTEQDHTRTAGAALRSVFGDGAAIGRGPVSGRANKVGYAAKV